MKARWFLLGWVLTVLVIAPSAGAVPADEPPPVQACADPGPQRTVAGTALTVPVACDDPGVRVVTDPGHGTATVTAQGIEYAADHAYAGEDAFAFAAGTADPVTVTVDVASGVPVCGAVRTSTHHATPVALDLRCTSPRDRALTYALVDPAHGRVEDTTFTPDPGFTGTARFAYTADDGLDTTQAAVSVDVTDTAPGCTAPDPQPAIAGLALHVTPACEDADGDPLSYVVVAGPAHGTLTFANGEYAYTPDLHHAGTDAFRFAADDGAHPSDPVTVPVEVASARPSCGATTAPATHHGTPAVVHLTCTDPRSLPLDYAAQDATGGTLGDVLGDTVAFTPDPGFTGDATFTVTAADADFTSAPATVTVPVTDTAPVCDPVPAGAAVGGVPVAFTVRCRDADGDPLTVSATRPGHGSAAVDGTTITYTPDAGFADSDAFTVAASDGALTSDPEPVAVAVSSGRPVCADLQPSTRHGKPVTIALTCATRRGTTLAYTVTPGPGTHGTLSAPSGGQVVFTPAAGHVGPATFAYTATDTVHRDESDAATVTVDVTDTAPSCAAPGQVTATGGVAVTTTVECADEDGDPLTLRVAGAPAHGKLTAAGAKFTYTPDLTYAGDDAYTVTAGDGALSAEPVTVPIVTAPQLYADQASVGGKCSDARTLADAVTRTTPLCTLDRAIALAPPGGTVTLRRGTYTEKTVGDHVRGRRVWIQPAPGEKAVLKTVTIASSEGLGLRGLALQYLRIDDSSDIVVAGNDATAGGLWVSGSHHVTFRGNQLHDATDGFVVIRSQDVTITDNDVFRIPTTKRKSGGDGVQTNDADRLTITGNRFSQFRAIPHSDAIELTRSNDDVTISGNTFKQIRGVIATPGGTGAYAVNARWLIANNVFTAGYEWPLKLTDTPGARIVANTMSKAGPSGLRITAPSLGAPPAAGVVIANNIADRLDLKGPVAYEDHNMVLAGPSTGAHDLRTPPRYVNAATDLRLRPGSPGIDAGTTDLPFDAPRTDFAGTLRDAPPDIGAYETP